MPAAIVALAACATPPAIDPPVPAGIPAPVPIATPAAPPAIAPSAPLAPPAPPARAAPALPLLPSLVIAPPSPAPSPPVPRYDRTRWVDVPGWSDDASTEAWTGWLRSCHALRQQPAWQRACAEAAFVAAGDSGAQKRYFETNFTPYRIANADGTQTGLITGYYEPLLLGSRTRTARFRYPLYSPPPDLVAVDLGDTNPEIRDRRVRGRIVPGPNGGKLVPYYARAEIASGVAPVKGREIAWVDDPVELFFLQVQGSGRIQLPDGRVMRVGYADHNGHPYRSIGRWLVKRGEAMLDQASMQGIKAWVRRNPGRVDELLNQNPAYVFFRETPGVNADDGPAGSLGIALVAGASMAVDPRAIPLGTPVWLSTTWPLSTRPLNRLMLAHDTGSAIRGAVRADFFWGFGAGAAEQAGRMKQAGSLWMLWPNGEALPTDN